jgi:tetratricopeptide (TPR) repeat protein
MSENRILQLKSMLEESPNDVFILFALGKAYANMGNTLDSIDYYERLHSVDPNYTGLYLHWGLAAIKSSDKAKALQIFMEGISVCSKQGDLHAKAELMSAVQELNDD